MKPEIINSLYVIVAYSILFGSAELAYHKLKLKTEITRKYVHIFAGLITLTFPYILNDFGYVFALCAGFFGMLYFSKAYGFLPSVNAIDRDSHGGILYPVATALCFFIYTQYDNEVFFYLPMLTLAISDAFAGLVGKFTNTDKIPIGDGSKSWGGTLTFITTSFMVSFLTLNHFTNLSTDLVIAYTTILALATTAAEAFTKNGFDNITIPASALVGLMVLEHYTHSVVA